METCSHDISILLRHIQDGDKEAENSLWNRLYPELHRLAQRYANAERSDHTLSPTALLHEAYLHLVEQGGKTWVSKVHFLGVAAHVMRRVLVDHARKHRVGKRAGAHMCISLEEEFVVSLRPAKHILALDDALAELEKVDPQQSRVVEMRFFGGLTEQETAEVLGISVRTVTREWSMAKAWLCGQLQALGE